MVAYKGLLVDPPFICWFFGDVDCPICRYVLKNILRGLQIDNLITIEEIDVQFNRGTRKVSWFEEYSAMTEEALTPTIKLIDRYETKIGYREDTVKILHLWKEKGLFLTKQDVEKSNMLRDHIIEAIKKYRRKYFAPYHDQKRSSKSQLPRTTQHIHFNPFINKNPSFSRSQ
jgi:hypothetical protein